RYRRFRACNTRPWQNRQKYIRTGRDKAVARRDTGLNQARILRREEETIPHARSIGGATSRAISRVQTLVIGKSRNRRGPTTHFVATARATRSARKILRHIRLSETTAVPSGALTRRARGRSNRTGSAWRSTTTPRSGT